MVERFVSPETDVPTPRRATRIRRALPGDLLLHPVALVAMAVVIVNDRWVKIHHPGLLSGKLSDFAGLIYFPLFVATLVEVCRWAIRGRHWTVTPGFVGGVATVTGVIFLFAKVTSWGGDAYRAVFGLVWWPADALRSLLNGDGWPPIGRLGLTQDVSDLVALPCLVVPVLVARRVTETRGAAEQSVVQP